MRYRELFVVVFSEMSRDFVKPSGRVPPFAWYAVPQPLGIHRRFLGVERAGLQIWPRPLGLAISANPASPASPIRSRVTPPRHPASHPASSGHIDGATISRHERRAILSRRNHVWAHWSRNHFWTHGSRGFGCVSHLSRNGWRPTCPEMLVPNIPCATNVFRNGRPRTWLRPGETRCVFHQPSMCLGLGTGTLRTVSATHSRNAEILKKTRKHKKTLICTNILKTT